jgi:hypothetical protein
MKCDLCGQDPCSDFLDDSVPVFDETPPTERVYRVRSEITEDGRLILQPGQIITLQEAVLRNLPGAHEMATHWETR